MAAKILNSLGKVGIGLAITGGIVSNALYNGKATSCFPSTIFCKETCEMHEPAVPKNVNIMVRGTRYTREGN